MCFVASVVQFALDLYECFNLDFCQGEICLEFLSVECIYIHHCWEQLMISWDPKNSKKRKSKKNSCLWRINQKSI